MKIQVQSVDVIQCRFVYNYTFLWKSVMPLGSQSTVQGGGEGEVQLYGNQCGILESLDFPHHPCSKQYDSTKLRREDQ
jgi:hypothetical protein